MQGLWRNTNTSSGIFFNNDVRLLIRHLTPKVLTLVCQEEPVGDQVMLQAYTGGLGGNNVCSFTVHYGALWKHAYY